jgi:hypothetical protein
MPQQQQSFGGFGGGFGGFGGFGGYGMPQQRGFGGFGGYGMPQQQMGGFGGYGMPQQRAESGASNLANAYQQFQAAQGQPGLGGSQSASQSAAPQPMTQPLPPQQEGRIDPNTYTRSPFNLEGGQQAPMDQMQRQQQLMSLAQMPGNPYAQQMRQEDPRMQAMRNMQRMRFGGYGF